MTATELDTSLAEVGAAVSRLERAIGTTDAAVLAIGRVVDQIVPLATAPAAAAAAGELAVTTRLEAVGEASTGFLDDTRGHLARQADVARQAAAALEQSRRSARVVSDLMGKSRMLALNLRIEAARLGGENGGLQAIGQEMVQFSHEVKQANETILAALEGLSRSVPRVEAEAVALGQQADAFADTLRRQLASVRADVDGLRASVAETERRAAERNDRILALAQQAMSELQFHDPLVQELRAVIAALTGDPSGLNGAAVARSVYGDTDPDRASGEVDLF